MDIEIKNLNNSLGLFTENFENLITQKFIDLVVDDLFPDLKINFSSECVPVEDSVKEKLLAFVGENESI